MAARPREGGDEEEAEEEAGREGGGSGAGPGAEEEEAAMTGPWVERPRVPRSFAEELDEFFRRWSPSRRGEAAGLARDYATPERAQALRRHLEGRFRCPGFFERLVFDFRGRFFDPRHALYDPDVLPPMPHAAPLDNVGRFLRTLPAHRLPAEVRILREKNLLALDGGVRDERREMAQAEAAAREARRPPKVPFADKLAASFVDGPLSVLRRCFEGRVRVRVAVRRATGMRGVLRGFVKAFDRHWNVVLVDAHREEWAVARSEGGEGEGEGGGGVEARGEQAVVRSHRMQVLLRGDCIISIAAEPRAGPPPARVLRLLLK